MKLSRRVENEGFGALFYPVHFRTFAFSLEHNVNQQAYSKVEF